MTFDQCLEDYRSKRDELRQLQSDMDKLANERRRISKDIKAKHREYKTKHREMLDAMAQLVPELNKEVQAHPMPSDLSDQLIDNENGEQQVPVQHA